MTEKSFMRKAMPWVVAILVGAIFGPVGVATVVVVGTVIVRASAIVRSSRGVASSSDSHRKQPECVSSEMSP
jgi:hypothetical protein